MKATFVLLADPPAENLGRKLMLKANQIGDTGFEMARLPHHISLKQPFKIKSLDDIEAYFDSFAQSLSPITAKLQDVVLWPSNVFGYESGVLVVAVEKTSELFDLHIRLNRELEEKFGACPAGFDGELYSIHMTFALGGVTYEQYEKVYAQLSKEEVGAEYTFSELGLLFYDNDDIKPGTYFCYKRVRL